MTLCYSVAEYAAPGWARSKHVHFLNHELTKVCRSITACIKPKKCRELVFSRMEKTKQLKVHEIQPDEKHSLFGQTTAVKRLRYSNRFLSSVQSDVVTGNGG